MERWAYEYFRRQAIEDRCKQEAQWLIDNPKDSIRKMALLIPLVVMEPEGDIVEELKKLDMRRNVMVEC